MRDADPVFPGADAFLQAIAANPSDDTLRLVFADWLEERGDWRAEFLRLDCALRGMTAAEHHHADAWARWNTLRTRLDPRWLATLGKGGLPTDPRLFDVCGEVVHYFKSYDSYRGRRREATRALARRVPGFEAGQYQALFDILCRVYDVAVAAISRHRLVTRKKRGEYAEAADIDSEACMKEMDAIAPGYAMAAKSNILAWVIDWYYLR
jgi:uncharacterized protein (TIGR02996 family)